MEVDVRHALARQRAVVARAGDRVLDVESAFNPTWPNETNPSSVAVAVRYGEQAVAEDVEQRSNRTRPFEEDLSDEKNSKATY